LYLSTIELTKLIFTLLLTANRSLPNLSDGRAQAPAPPPSPSSSHPSSSQSSLGSLGRKSQPPNGPEGFSVFVTDISGARPVSGHSDSFARVSSPRSTPSSLPCRLLSFLSPSSSTSAGVRKTLISNHLFCVDFWTFCRALPSRNSSPKGRAPL